MLIGITGNKEMDNKGFTLVELITVMLLLAVLSAVTIPRIGNYLMKRELDNAASELAIDLRWMQQVCINSGTGPFPCLIVKYSKPYGYFITLNTNTIKQNIFAGNVKINGSIPQNFSFGMNGYPTTNLTISLQNGSNIRYIVIDSIGRIRIAQ